MKKRLLIFFWLVSTISLAFAQIPPYYNSIDFSQNGDVLEQDLAQLIFQTHAAFLPYTSSDTDTWDAVQMTDLAPESTQNLLLFYGYDDTDGDPQTDYTRDKDLSCHTSSCVGLYNREHVYARSIANPSLTTDDPGPGTDVHNLRACDSQMNGARSNRLFDDDSGDSHITSSGNWYPGDEWKGDVARIIMYMYLRYPSQCPANDIGDGTNTNDPNMPDVFLQWNAEDPVSEYELQRNTILESLQGNRNPFIDNPYLATKIWGGNPAEDSWGVLNIREYELDVIKLYPMPVEDILYISNTTLSNIQALIYDLNGKRTLVKVSNNSLNVEKLQSGVYILELSEGGRKSKYKFVKE